MLLDTMYDLPDKEDVEKVVIDEKVVKGDKEPTFVYADKKKKKSSKKSDDKDDAKEVANS